MDTMQARIEQLEQENAALRALLKKARDHVSGDS